MKLIADKTLKTSLKNLGFSEVDDKVFASVNELLLKFVTKSLKSKSKSPKSKSAKSSQRGGAETTLPLEYFGVDSGHYAENVPQGVNMSVTADNVRPVMGINDPQNLIEKFGGASKGFFVPKTAVVKAVKEANLTASACTVETLKTKFESLFSEILKKAVKDKAAQGHLTASLFSKYVSQKKYTKFF